jgi:RNA polymerase sigma-70 factor (ECF subfamily)
VLPEQPPGNLAAQERAAWILRTLRAAVARACPSDLATHREDLVQAALVRVLEHERADEHNRVRTASYLWRVAFSVIADELRRRRAEEERSRRSSMEEQTGQQGSTPAAELGLGIRDCLQTLAEPRRVAVLLHLEGFRAEEASGVLRWNVKRVRNLTYRGLADLRRCLEGKGLVP